MLCAVSSIESATTSEERGDWRWALQPRNSSILRSGPVVVWCVYRVGSIDEGKATKGEGGVCVCVGK